MADFASILFHHAPTVQASTDNISGIVDCGYGRAVHTSTCVFSFIELSFMLASGD